MTKSKGIDYSKWDKMDFSDEGSSEDEDSNLNSTTSRPIVTRLDQPSSVTFGGDNKVKAPAAETTAVSRSSSTSTGVESNGRGESCTTETVDERGSANAEPRVNAPASSSPRATKTEDATPPIATDANGLDVRKIRVLTMNGGSFRDPSSPSGCDTYWSQDRYEVVLSVAFDPSLVAARDIRVCVTGALPYADRFSATGSAGACGEGSGAIGRGRVVVSSGERSRVVLLQGDLPNFAHLPEGEEEVDWEIDTSTHPKRGLVRLTLLKAVPMQGMTIWWSRPLLHFPEIDVEKDIKGRCKVSPGHGASNDNNTQSAKVKAAWDEAHRLFRDKVKKREKQIIQT